MLYGIFSDIHGNLEALETVLSEFKKLGVEHYSCCGDLVGYGPNPDECVQKIASMKNIDCVCGNHDFAVLGGILPKWFNPYAWTSIEFSRSVLGESSMEFLKARPQRIENNDFTMVHGSPRNPIEEYFMTAEQFLENADFWEGQLCFVGHTHIALCMSRNGVQFPASSFPSHDDVIKIEEGFRYIINPGSVGQPRDKDKRAACMIYDSDKKEIRTIRLEYPLERTQEAMRKVRLPELLIDRLSVGF